MSSVPPGHVGHEIFRDIYKEAGNLMHVRFEWPSIASVFAAVLSMSGVAPSARGQASDACWVRGDPSDVAGRASQHDSVSLALDGGTIKVCYGRPRARGRTVMGQLVPYSSPWRMGADEATAIHVPFRARIAGVDVAPGWYSLYAIPEAKQWRIVVNREPQRWGIPINDAVRTRDVGSGSVVTEHLDTPVEALTITLQPRSKSAATMEVSWENTRVRIPLERR
jgi:DUF2911 family protein